MSGTNLEIEAQVAAPYDEKCTVPSRPHGLVFGPPVDLPHPGIACLLRFTQVPLNSQLAVSERD